MSPDSPASSSRVSVTLATSEVLLTEDRGLVTRRGPVAWSGGPVVVELGELSPALVDASLQVALRDARGVATVGDVAVLRRWVPLARPSERDGDALAREALDRRDQIEQLDLALARLQTRDAAVAAELGRYAAAVVRNAGRGLFDPARLEADLAELRARLLAGPPRAQALRLARWEASRAHADLKAMIAALETGAQRLATTVAIALDAPGPVEATLELRYLLPNALWRPTYEAHLSTGPEPRVSWRVQGMVWQRTGEDWRDVRVTLSTARPSSGTSLPPLSVDRLAVRPKTAEERRTTQADFRDQTIQSAQLTASAQPEALPGVDDGGETRVLTSATAVDLPSDGRPHRVHVSTFAAPAKVRWLCVPERDTAVFREVSLEHRGAEPLLAGPVVLLVDGAYTGVGEVPFVSPGERFALSFGSNDDLVVTYARTRKIEKRKLQSDLTWFVSETTLHHTGGAAIDLEVLGRLPVSELSGVTVVRSPTHTRPGADGPDEHGHVRWRIRMQPGSREDVPLGFRLEVSGNVQLPDPW